MTLNFRKPLVTLLAITACFVLNAKHYDITVDDFDELWVVDDINVEYYCDDALAGHIIFDEPEDVAQMMIFNCNDKGKLRIDMGFDDSRDIEQTPTIKVYSTGVVKIVNEGNEQVTVFSNKAQDKIVTSTVSNGTLTIHDINATTVEVKVITGKGKIILDGTCDQLKVNDLGKGVINARRLATTHTSCTLTGTGKVYCQVNGGTLNIKGTGTGKVYYTGSPAEIKVKKLGTIKAIKME